MQDLHSVSVYTVVAVLRNMRQSLGLEAMSEFIDLYTNAAERKDPRLRRVLNDALTERAINHLYRTVADHDKA